MRGLAQQPTQVHLNLGFQLPWISHRALVAAHDRPCVGIQLQKIQNGKERDNGDFCEREVKIRNRRSACQIMVKNGRETQRDCTRSNSHPHRHLLNHAGKGRCAAHLYRWHIRKAQRIETRELHGPAEAANKQDGDYYRHRCRRIQKCAGKQR